MWNNPQTAGFCWFGRSSRGVDPVASSHTQPYGHFTGCEKTKQTTEGGRKKQTNMDLELQTQEGEVGILAFYVCSWLLRELCENPTQLPKMPTHLVLVLGLTFWLSAPESRSKLTVPLLPTDCFGVSLLNDWRPSSFSSGREGFRGPALCVVFALK